MHLQKYIRAVIIVRNILRTGLSLLLPNSPVVFCCECIVVCASYFDKYCQI